MGDDAMAGRAGMPDADPGDEFGSTLLGPGALRQRGWTHALIGELMPDPDALRASSHDPMGAPLRFWSLRRTLSAEADARFADGRRRERAKAPRPSAEDVAAFVAGIEVKVEEVSTEAARERAVASYNRLQEQKYLGKLVRQEDCDQGFLDRITVNVIRHDMTSYDRDLEALAGRIEWRPAMSAMRERTYAAIARAHPTLAAECRRQLAVRADSGMRGKRDMVDSNAGAGTTKASGTPGDLGATRHERAADAWLAAAREDVRDSVAEEMCDAEQGAGTWGSLVTRRRRVWRDRADALLGLMAERIDAILVAGMAPEVAAPRVRELQWREAREGDDTYLQADTGLGGRYIIHADGAGRQSVHYHTQDGGAGPSRFASSGDVDGAIAAAMDHHRSNVARALAVPASDPGPALEDTEKPTAWRITSHPVRDGDWIVGWRFADRVAGMRRIAGIAARDAGSEP